MKSQVETQVKDVLFQVKRQTTKVLVSHVLFLARENLTTKALIKDTLFLVSEDQTKKASEVIKEVNNVLLMIEG